MNEIPRYSRLPFPPYAFVPGRNPHPTRDAQGHSYGRPPEPLPMFDASRWQHCEQYLYGIDLFNAGYWWEAHEALETVWIAAGRRTPPGLFVQGLIQLGVAMLKRHQGHEEAARRLASEGLAKLLAQPDGLLGIDSYELARQTEYCLPDPAAPPVRIRLAGVAPVTD